MIPNKLKASHISPDLLKLLGVAIFCLLGIFACGGGTSGTGDANRKVIKGALLTTNRSPLVEAQIIVAETGDQTLTDNNGNFFLESAITDYSPVLIVRSAGLDTSVEINEVSSDAKEISLLLIANKESNKVSVEKIEIEIAPLTNLPASEHASNQAKDSNSNFNKDNESQARTSSWLIQGNLKFIGGSPVKSAIVTYESSNNSSTSDQNGNFSILSQSQKDTATLTISYLNHTTQIKIQNLPLNKDLNIKVQIILKLDSAQIDPNNPNSGNERLSAQLINQEVTTR
jgi:hypothetical protein